MVTVRFGRRSVASTSLTGGVAALGSVAAGEWAAVAPISSESSSKLGPRAGRRKASMLQSHHIIVQTIEERRQGRELLQSPLDGRFYSSPPRDGKTVGNTVKPFSPETDRLLSLIDKSHRAGTLS